MSEEKEAVGFKLQGGKLIQLLEHLQASGTTLAGEKMDFMEDCIIRVTKKGIWSITIDASSHLVAFMKINITSADSQSKAEHGLETYNSGNIPININQIKKYIKRFKSSDMIEFIYENGINVLKTSNLKVSKLIKVEAFIAGIREENIRYDMIKNTLSKYAKEKEEEIKGYLDYFKKYHSPYKLSKEKDAVSLYNGTVLNNFVELSCDNLKEVIKDGELHENRTYPFQTTNKDSLTITSKDLKDSTNHINRDMYLKKSSIKEDFTIEYPSQFNAAVASTSGHVSLYWGPEKPLLLIKTSDQDYGINLGYIIGPRLED